MGEYSIWGIVVLVLQIYCAFHAFRRQRIFWGIINLLFIFSAVIYLILYIIPERRGSGGMRMPGGSFKPNVQIPSTKNIFISPQKKLDELIELVEQSDTVENRRKVADQYFVMEQYEKALAMYESCLTGIFKDDPAILTDAAKTSYLINDLDKTLRYINEIENTKPNYTDRSFLLVKARVLQSKGLYDEAIGTLEDNLPYFKGLEGKYRLAELYTQVGQIENGVSLAEEVIEELNMASKTFQDEQSLWKEEAMNLLRTHRKE
jgi:hypothetical protein